MCIARVVDFEKFIKFSVVVRMSELANLISVFQSSDAYIIAFYKEPALDWLG